MKINDSDKNQIQLIDAQVKNLQDRNASDEAILDALVEFIPDTTCLVENAEKAELQMYLGAHPHFAYFVSLISLAMSASTQH